LVRKLLPFTLFFLPVIAGAYVTFKFPENPQKVQRDFDDIEQEIKNIKVPANPTVFSISSFADNQPSVIEIASAGTWASAGSISFTATYANGPATSAAVSGPGFSNLVMTNSFMGPTATGVNISYPSVGGTVSFVLSATNGTQHPTASIIHYFNNDRYYGLTTQTSGWTSSQVTAFGTSDLVNSIPLTFTVTAGSGQYIVNAYPSRLGTSTYFVGGFAGGFLGPYTVSVTNGSGFTENYYVYVTVNQNLGLTTVTVVTP
jgi:hypothetical protein